MDFNIEFTNYKGKADDRLWIESFMDNVILKRMEVRQDTLKLMGEEAKRQQEYNLFHSLDYRGGAVAKKLNPSRYGGNKVFLNTGELYRSVMMNLTKTYAEIFIGNNRKQIAYWLATGTRKMVARPFFGLSEQLKQRISQIYYKQING